MPYLTTDAPTDETVCRRFRIPVNQLANFMGALYVLTAPFQWEQFGDLTPDEQAELFSELIDSYSEGCMVGVTFSYVTTDPPEGSLPLDGSTYDGTDYPLLYPRIDAQWDNGDGTFTLPDARGRAVIGTGAGTGLTARSVGDTMGEETHTLTTAEMPAHVHSDTTTGVTAADPVAGVPLPAASVAAPSTTGSTGGGLAHENMQPSLALPMAVWYQ